MLLYWPHPSALVATESIMVALTLAMAMSYNSWFRTAPHSDLNDGTLSPH